MQFFNLTFKTAKSPKNEFDSKAGLAGSIWGPLPQTFVVHQVEAQSGLAEEP